MIGLKNLLLNIVLFLCLVINGSAQNNASIHNSRQVISLDTELRSFYDLSLLPQYHSNTIVAQTSTYDTTGGNNDGFNGTYSFLRRDKDSNLVIFDVKGAGVVNRIWTPTPTSDTLDFYIDDTLNPAFSIKYLDLFSNKIYPFINPLCGNELGGYYCYLPIPFQSSCKIVCRARETQFHQVQYRLYPGGTRVKKFSLQLEANEKATLKKIAGLWENSSRSLYDFYDRSSKIITAVKTVTLSPGQARQIFNTTEGGRILKIQFENAAVFEGLRKQVDIKITWDGERTPAVYCPVADFFGYAFGKTSMQGLLLGTQEGQCYSYLPMPFDKSARITLEYRKGAIQDGSEVQLKATIFYTTEKRHSNTEGKLYTSWNSNKLNSNDRPHVFLNTTGKGHYVGSVLLAQGIQPGMTYFFEGDDSTAVDNVARVHGTGSEDYFNGGWYAFPDRWSRKMSLPLHGALDYSLPFCRTGAYRFYLSDKISFEKNIYQSIEHGPQHNSSAVDYTSLAFYYGNVPPSSLVKPVDKLTAVYMPDTLIMYPQLMNFTIWDNITAKASWAYNTGGQTFTFSAADESRLKISLEEIPAGNYMLYADITNSDKGCAFSLWQLQKQVSEWITTANNGKDERVPLKYINEINLGEFNKSLTVQFKTSAAANNFLLSRLVFVRKTK